MTGAYVANRSHDFSFAFALGALLLHGLDESWHDLLSNLDVALSSALGACFDMIGIISTTSTAMRANSLLRVTHLKVASFIQFLKRSPDLQLDARSNLLIPITRVTIKKRNLLLSHLLAKNVAEWAPTTTSLTCSIFLLILNCLFLTKSIEIFAPFLI